MFTENCKKIEPVVVKLYSKTKYITFFLNTVYMLNILQVVLDSVQPSPPCPTCWVPPVLQHDEL